MILLPSRRITKPQSGGSVDLQRAHDSGTLYLSFADAGFTDRIGGGVVRNPGGLALGPNGKIATFNGAQQANSPLWLGDSHTGLIVAARILATGAQAGTPVAAFGVYDSTSQGGFGVGFDPSGNAGAALLTSGGAYLNAKSPVGLNKWVTVFAQIIGGNAGLSAAYVDGQPATVGQAGSYVGDTRTPREIAYGAQHRSSGFLRGFKGAIEWAAILRVDPGVDGWRSLTDSLALELYESGYPYNLIKTTRRVYFDMGAGGGDVVLAGSSASQVNTSSSGAITQTHVLSGASVDQSNTSTSGAIGQSIILTGASVAQGNATTSGSVAQTHVLIGSNCQQANTSTSGAVVQTGDLIGANCAQVNTSSSGSISQTHVLSGASCTQPNTTTSGAVIIVSVVTLTGANCAQGNTTTTGSISQSHVLIGAPVAIDHIATASSIVQTHILSGADCSQSNYSTTGSINQVVIPSQFVASVPAGVFSARAPAGEYSATVPAGNYRASI